MRNVAETTPIFSSRALFGRRLLGALALALGLAVAARASTTTWPSLINFQGQLTDGSGTAVTDTAYSIQFLIYDSPTAGTLLWNEVQPTVNTSKGLFNVVLGSVLPVSLSSYANDLWLAVKVGADPEMSPRQQLLPSVYALNAQRLGGASIGSGPSNIPQLDAGGHLPASMIGAGSLTVPFDMTGAGGTYNLRINNTSAAGKGLVIDSSSGIAISATTASTASPAVYAEGARYGLTVQTDDGALGVALQAQIGSAYASLVDKVNNAQVYGKAAAATTYGVLGTNSAPSAASTGIGGNAPSGIGVSGTGGTYGVYGASASGNGVEGISSSGGYGVYASSVSGSGLYAVGNSNFGVYGISSGYTGVYGSGGVYGLYGTGPTAVYATGSNIGVLSTGAPYGVSSTGSTVGVFGAGTGATAKGVWGDFEGTGVGYGLYGQTSSSANGSTGVFGYSSASTGTTDGVEGLNYSTAGGSAGVWGTSVATTTNITAGVFGNTQSNNGYGVIGAVIGSGAGTGRGVFGNSSMASGAGVEGQGFSGAKGTSGFVNGYGVYGSASASDGSGTGGYFVNTASAGNGTAVVADGYSVGLSATANNGYAVEASGYGGGDFSGSSNYGLNVSSVNNYGLNVNSTNSWGIQVNAANGYGMVNFSSSGVYSYATGSNGYTGYGTNDGIYASSSSSSGGSGVYGIANCATCFGIYALNSASSGPGTGLYAEGYTMGLSVTARSGTAVKAWGSTGVYSTGGSGGINFYSDATNNPSYGFYHYAAPTTTSFGLYDLNNNPSGHAAFLYNLSPASTDSGDALYVRGKIRATDSAAKYVGGATATTSWVISNASIEAGSIIMTTLGTSSGYPLWISSVSAGSFTVNCSQSLASAVIYYWIVSR